jgi:hypothetical protein
MPYSKFTLDSIEQKFGIKNQVVSLFQQIQPLEPSEWLQMALLTAQELPIKSEKAKSESIVFPILVELRNKNDKYFTIHSGDTLTADEEQELEGECDFILSKDSQTFNINFPIFQLVEAKKNDTEVGVAQCAAQMIGARIYNAKKGFSLEKIYGCVTTGKDWLFLELENNIIYIDKKVYALEKIEILLGVFQKIIDYCKVASASVK